MKGVHLAPGVKRPLVAQARIFWEVVFQLLETLKKIRFSQKHPQIGLCFSSHRPGIFCSVAWYGKTTRRVLLFSFVSVYPLCGEHVRGLNLTELLWHLFVSDPESNTIVSASEIAFLEMPLFWGLSIITWLISHEGWFSFLKSCLLCYTCIILLHLVCKIYEWKFGNPENKYLL